MNVDDTLRKGMTSTPKYIPFWYLYDKQGSVLFEKCWRRNQYHYMSETEKSLIKENVQGIINEVPTPIVLIDLGCGNCDKTRLFIDAILERQDRLDFLPVDISEEFLRETSKTLAEEYNNKMKVHPCVAEYADGIRQLRNETGNKLILWFGGLQNLTYPDQVERLIYLSKTMSAKDRLVLSLDITQDPEEIKQAYMDPTGMVADFIDNAFSRLNGDYGSKIDVNKLELEVEYTQRTECNTCSYLTMKERALETQTYDIPGLGISLHLEAGECIHISDSGAESTCKYTIEQIQYLVKAGQLILEQVWEDENHHIALCVVSNNK